MAVPAKTVGRPTKYKADVHPNLCLSFLLLDQSLTDKALAYLLGIAEDTLYRWKDRHPEFAEAIFRGKHLADAEVASKMHERAVGTVVRKQKPVVLSGGKDEPATVEIVDFEEEVPADVGAGFKWLALRQREKWHEKTEQINLNVNIEFRDYVAELRRRFGDDNARNLLESQGYAPALIEGEFEVLTGG